MNDSNQPESIQRDPNRRYKRIRRPYTCRSGHGKLVQYPTKPRGNKPTRIGPQPFEVRALRTKLGMTLKQFAKAMGVSSETVILWERDKIMTKRHQPAFRKMQELAPHVLARRAKPDWSL